MFYPKIIESVLSVDVVFNKYNFQIKTFKNKRFIVHKKYFLVFLSLVMQQVNLFADLSVQNRQNNFRENEIIALSNTVEIEIFYRSPNLLNAAVINQFQSSESENQNRTLPNILDQNNSFQILGYSENENRFTENIEEGIVFEGNNVVVGTVILSSSRTQNENTVNQVSLNQNTLSQNNNSESFECSCIIQ